MAPATPKDEGPQEPAPISPGGTYTIQSVSVGCKIYIRRLTGDSNTEERHAEILSIRERVVNKYAIRRQADTAGLESAPPEDKLEYFVHWDAFNKRLDEWVSGSRLVLSRDMEWPRPKTVQQKKLTGAAKKAQLNAGANKAPGKVPRAPSAGGGGKSLLKRASLNAAALAAATPSAATPISSMTPPGYPFVTPTSPTPSLGISPSLKRKRSDHEEEEEDEQDEDADADADGDADSDAGSDADADGDPDADGEMDVDAEGEGETFELMVTGAPAEPPPPLASFSKEAEIEKLRTSGSMTQSVSEVARVKNLNRLQMGKHEIDAWYFSPYPQEYAHLPVLYLCEFCLSYFPSEFMLGRHRKRCNLLHPPGNEIYRHEDISFYELDGKRQLQYCRNLSLLSKCFLDHKTLYYDVTPFLYYLMCQRDSSGAHLIGYFSKEKESAESYNVACILTLPQHQRHGYGKLIIEFSYELSKKEGRLGSPEKPLSDLGLLGYRAYWAEAIVDLLLAESEKGDAEVSIDDIAQKTSLTHGDIMNTCTTLQLFKHYKGQHVICLSDAVLERHEKVKAKRRRKIHSECLIWKPPVFTRDQLRFGW